MELVVAVSRALVELVVVIKVVVSLDSEEVVPLVGVILLSVSLHDAQLAGVVLDALLWE